MGEDMTPDEHLAMAEELLRDPPKAGELVNSVYQRQVTALWHLGLAHLAAIRARQATPDGRRCPAHVQLPGATGPADRLAYCRLELGHAGGHEIAVGEPSTPDGPRRWALPDEPGPEVTAVRDRLGRIWSRVRGLPLWGSPETGSVLPFVDLLDHYGPLTDVTPATDGQDGRDG
jgi:hypothetical protein